MRDTWTGEAGTRDLLNPNPEERTMTDPNPSGSWRARAFVLGGVAFAFVVTVFSVFTGIGVRFLGGIWFWAVIWTVLAALACALWRGFRHGDWSAFGRCEFAEDNGDRFDWATRTGRYAWLRDFEDRDLHDHGRLRGHGPSTRSP